MTTSDKASEDTPGQLALHQKLVDGLSRQVERQLSASDDSDRNDAWWRKLTDDERSRLMDQCHNNGELLP
jgi:hypothetical protein